MNKKLSLLLLLSVALPVVAEEPVDVNKAAEELQKASQSHIENNNSGDKEVVGQNIPTQPGIGSRVLSSTVSGARGAYSWCAALVANKQPEPVAQEDAAAKALYDEQAQQRIRLVAQTVLEEFDHLQYTNKNAPAFNNLQNALAKQMPLVAERDRVLLLNALDQLALTTFKETHGKEDQKEACDAALTLHNIIKDHGNHVLPQKGNVVSRFVEQRPGATAAVVAVVGSAAWYAAHRAGKAAGEAAYKATVAAAVNAAEATLASVKTALGFQ